MQKAKQYAVGAFNVYNLDTLNAVVQAAEVEHSPAIIQLYTADFVNQGRSVFASAALEAIKNHRFHLHFT